MLDAMSCTFFKSEGRTERVANRQLTLLTFSFSVLNESLFCQASTFSDTDLRQTDLNTTIY